MKSVSFFNALGAETAHDRAFAVDTTFVLFFLAVEFGRIMTSLSLDSVVFGVTLLLVMVAPYFLPSDEKPEFSSWLMGRTLIAGFAVVVGAGYDLSLNVLPEVFKYLPMTLLIVTAMLSCYIQFYGLLRLKIVR